jgi:hypothetical protein
VRTSLAPAFLFSLTSLASAGCGFSGSEGTPREDGGIIEPEPEPPPPIDAPTIPQMAIDFLPPTEETFASGNWDIDGAVTIDTTTLTASIELPPNVTLTEGTQHDGLTKVAILRANNFKVKAPGVVKVKGSRALFILAGNDLGVDGVLDASADLASPGPGGSSGGMNTGAGRSSVHDGGSFLFPRYNDSGAGGGSFGSSGAAGGRAGYAAGSGPGRTYGIGNKLVGGASGGRAGNCPNPPGAGGGALLLYGHKKIDIKGVVSAGGGGGAGGLDMNCAPGAGAGAGGGSGGIIWLQTPVLIGDGLLTANGGGGGGGSTSQGGNGHGSAGANAHSSATLVALGGAKANSAEATAGGNGAIEGTPASMVPALNAGNGGGGGGGLGRIVFNAPIIDNIKSSPTAEAAP